jgi:preprotein translocase subunit SecD
VRFSIKGAAQQSFADFTGSRINQPLCIVLDGVVLSCPTIQAKLTDGGVITGRFTSEEARQLAVTLNYGALPVPLKIEAVREVGATLGADAVRKSVIAGVIGFIVLAIFMLFNYRLPGVVGVIALAIFVLLSLAVFILLPVVLTLPGIAGFIISIAAAVDANILVFERFREEMRAGRSLRGAVEASFQRAWPSIRDSNFSTLLICAILFLFGSAFGASAVRGFAINLVIGIVVSLFCAMTVTRVLMRLTFETEQASSLADRPELLGV